MTESLVHKKLERTLQVKTLTDFVRAKNQEQVYLLIDVSGSMRDTMRNGKERIDGLREVVKGIQEERRTLMIAFGGSGTGSYGDNPQGVRVVSSVPNAGGSTPLTQAIDLARTQNAGRVIVISDGMPDNPTTALEAAKRLGGRIDVVFVGDPGEYGEAFLKQLAEATGGTEFHGDLSEPKKITGGIVGLLTTGDDDE